MTIFTRQQGVTMVSLMVGLFISMMCVLGSLTLYKNMITVAAEAKVDAVHDGQLAASMLTVQKEVMTAGFGIEDADADDIVRRKVDATEDTPGTIEFFWRYQDAGTVYCRGLREHGVIRDDGLEFRILDIIEDTTANCDDANALDTLAWGTTVDTLAKWLVVGGLKTYIDTNSTLLDFQLAQQDCAPFGTTDPEAHWVLSVSAPGAAKLNGAASVGDTAYFFCLSNTYPPA